jgi:transposase
MDSHTISAQFGRLEVVETGRRRRWPEDEKLKIVLESLRAPRLVSATARRHGISRSLLLSWRRALQVERADAGSAPGFVPATIVPERLAERAPAAVTAATGRMEIVLARGRRVIVDAQVDISALARVLEVLERR